MTALVNALRALGLQAEVSLAGRWLRLDGERCAVFVVEAARGGYYTWCQDPAGGAVQYHLNPIEAISTGMDRAAMPAGSEHANSCPPESDDTAAS